MPAISPTLEKTAFFGLSPRALDDFVHGLGLSRFRGDQLRDWVYRKGVTDLAQMSNLPRLDRDKLSHVITFETTSAIIQQHSTDGTEKLLLTWPNGSNAETVMIPDDDRRTACVSSQVGCPVGCTFCASGVNGVKGNLTAAQIVEQVYALNRLMGEAESRNTEARRHGGTKARSGVEVSGDEATKGRSDEANSTEEKSVIRSSASPASLRRSAPSSLIPPPSITNIVFMGMGEPLANYQNVMDAIRILHDPKCFNISARKITVSTVGVPPKMHDLAHEDLPLNLAISLHAPTEWLRRKLIPWAEHFPINEILDAARYYFKQTGREITLEYILLAGVNDQAEHARELVKVAKTLRANVNLIRYNEVTGLPYKRPEAGDVMTFQRILRAAGVNTHIRKSRGRDIDAACGQLRRKQELTQLG